MIKEAALIQGDKADSKFIVQAKPMLEIAVMQELGKCFGTEAFGQPSGQIWASTSQIKMS